MSDLSVLEEGQRQIHEERTEINKRLRRWKITYYIVGVASVLAAAVAGVAGLADLITVQAAGAIAAAAAALGAIDKFLGAGGQVEQLTRECESLHSSDSSVDMAIVSARGKRRAISSLKAQIKREAGTPEADKDKKFLQLAIAEYDKWIQQEIDKVEKYLSQHVSNA